MVTKLITLEKKIRCTNCKTKLTEGRQVVRVYDTRGKVRANLCSEKCLNSYQLSQQ